MASYIDLVVYGDDRDLLAYLTGRVGASGSMRIVFAAEAGFHIEKLRERIRYHGEVQHVVVEAGHADGVRAALAAARPRYHFEIRAEHPIERARFTFEFDTPSRAVAGKLKLLLDALPAGAALSDYSPQESTDPGASGLEVYSPTHEFRFTGQGVISGDVFAVVDTRARLHAIDFTDTGEIEIEP